jgi:hypothetical protein
LGGVLKRLCDLYALYNMSVEMKHLLQEGVLAAEHSLWVDELIKDSLLPGIVLRRRRLTSSSVRLVR